jgi:ankyrin repeat protein
MDSPNKFDTQFDLNIQLLQLLHMPEINFSTAEVLIAAGANVNIENNDAQTILMLAAKLGDSDTVIKLLSTPGILVNKENSEQDTALILAARYDQASALSALLADPRVEINHAALRTAAGNGHIATLRVLLSYRYIQVNAADPWGDTALMEAASAGRINTLNALLAARGIDIHLANKAGKTAIMQAAKKGFEACVRFLAYKGAILPKDVQKQEILADCKGKKSDEELPVSPTLALSNDAKKVSRKPSTLTVDVEEVNASLNKLHVNSPKKITPKK